MSEDTSTTNVGSKKDKYTVFIQNNRKLDFDCNISGAVFDGEDNFAFKTIAEMGRIIKSKSIEYIEAVPVGSVVMGENDYIRISTENIPVEERQSMKEAIMKRGDAELLRRMQAGKSIDMSEIPFSNIKREVLENYIANYNERKEKQESQNKEQEK